jgi:signal transduction histidine kinase
VAVNADKFTEPLDNMRTSAEVLLSGAFGRLGGDQRENLKVIYTNSGALFALFMDIITHVGLENVVKRANLRRKFDELSQPIQHSTSDLLRAFDGPLNEEQQIAIEYIRDIVQEIRTHADAVWLYSALHHRHIQASLRSFPLKAVLDDATSDIAPNLYHVQWDIPYNEAMAFADPHLTRRTLREILNNATDNKADAPITIRIHRDANQLVISVTDDGVGIDEAHHSDVFVPYFQVDVFSEGLGLGLAIARELIQLQNGQLTLESQIGFGATFRMSLPITKS